MAQIKITTSDRKTLNVKGRLTFTTELLKDEAGMEYIHVANIDLEIESPLDVFMRGEKK